MAAQKNSNSLDEDDSTFRKSRYIRFGVLVVGIIFFFGCHNYMQELIMSLPGFKVFILLNSTFISISIFIKLIHKTQIYLYFNYEIGRRISRIFRGTWSSSMFIL